MNSFAVLDSPESDTGVKTRSKQRRKSKGKESLEERSPSDLKSPKSSQKKKDKSKDHQVKQEVNGSPLEEDRQPSTSDSLERWSHQEPQPRWGFVGCVLKWIDTKIFQYNVTFGLYMLDRWERWLFNVCALSLLFAVGYSSYKIARPYSAALHESIEGLLKENRVPWQTNLG